MSILTDGSIAAIVASATDALLMYDVTLHVRAAGSDEYGNARESFSNVTLRGFRSEFSKYRRMEFGLPETDAKVLVLQQDAPATPRNGDEITVLGTRYLVLSVDADPAGATWELHARVK